jgi:hypothetical protein
VTAAANAKGVPIPSRANMTVRAARSVAAGRQVHHSDPNRPPTAMAASSQPVAPGRPCAVASTAATTGRPARADRGWLATVTVPSTRSPASARTPADSRGDPSPSAADTGASGSRASVTAPAAEIAAMTTVAAPAILR